LLAAGVTVNEQYAMFPCGSTAFILKPEYEFLTSIDRLDEVDENVSVSGATKAAGTIKAVSSVKVNPSPSAS